ncbi:hypothetical protein CsatA_017617 [Cannabis sativa]
MNQPSSMAKEEYNFYSLPTIDKCQFTNRENDTIVADMDGTLFTQQSSFPYFALVAYEVGGIFRLLFLLLASPLAGILYHFVSESAGIRVLIFATFVGMKVADINWVATAVLPKFYSLDLHPDTWQVFTSCKKRCILTASPKIMVEPFLKDYLGVDLVIGTEITSIKGFATGFVRSPGVIVGENKVDALRREFPDLKTLAPNIGLGDMESDYPFMKLCKESYRVDPKIKVKPLSREKLPKAVIFHDGRLVQKPTPLMALLIILWTPIAILLSCLRITILSLTPLSNQHNMLRVVGVQIKVKGNPPPKGNTGRSGLLFVCSHRTVLDAVFVAGALHRQITTVSYSIARLSEIISPIKTTPLSRDRIKDAALIKKTLEEGDLIICPEGTTCREPFLLRFSALFADLSDELVPVAISVKMGMFHGTTARGSKWMDPFYFMMNPSPCYELNFLDKLPYELTRRGGKTSVEVANYVQRLIASTLSFKCTNLTRKDKYMALAGNDGSVATKTS